MLTTLHISNYALIEHLDLVLERDFCVITGETGAGKSIILGALGLLQGNRADAKSIKSGAAKCVVEATFSLENAELRSLLQAEDIDATDDSLIVRREITAAGKSRAFINDTPVNLTLLREVSVHLIDIHSQHQNLLLSRENFLLDTLDGMAASPQLTADYAAAYHAFVQADRRLRQLRESAEKNQADREYLDFQLTQLDEAALVAGEQEELEEESAALSHAEEIKGAFYQSLNALQNEEFDVVSALRAAASALENAAPYFPAAETLVERLDSARIEIDDVRGDVERAADNVEADPSRLAFVDERLSLLYGLQKKHRLETVDALIELREDLRERLDAIENADEHIARAEKERTAALTALQACGAALTHRRQEAAGEVEQALVESLQGLGMPNVRLAFEFTPRPTPDATGCDTVRFLFSANKQVPPQDVAQTASGGEVARLMLSLKALIARKRHLPTIIFDEIDTGVSGTMAEKMGRVMQQMGENAQVVCITHLPQIAALGAAHYLVHKTETDTGTTSHISRLDNDRRVTEIANMLSGASITEAALANARELLSS